MNDRNKDRIECAIRHIQSSLDVDPWACEIAVEAMKKQLPQPPMQKIDVYNENLVYLNCPTCGHYCGMWNKRLGRYDMYNNANSVICAKCGQVFDLADLAERREE